MDAVEAAFEHDLQSWLTAVYQQRAGLNRIRLERRVLQILDTERRWLFPLTIGVVFGVGAVPMLGIAGVVGSLVLLYVGAVVSGYITMRRAERLEQSTDPRLEATAAAAEAWANRPRLGPEERAHLVRIINLSRVYSARQSAIRPLLLEEVDAALGHQPLAHWAVLRDMRELLHADTAELARLG